MKSVRALLQFTTILPLGEPADFGRFAQRSWLYPLAGYVTGGVAALPGLAAWYFGYTNSLVIAALTLALVIFITGANHFDGLLDLGDGLMAHGSRGKRIAAMTDQTTGAGALALGMMIVLITFAGFASLPPLWIAAAVLCGEVFGKMVMGLFSALGKPFHEGIQSYIYEHSKRRFAAYTVFLALPLFFLPEKIVVTAGLAAAFLVFGVLWHLARRCFGGVNGDVTGAGNEITRAAVAVMFALLLT
ncbi:adenosylcobinamide-GDP ribazoletransferase [Methanocorpusculum sp. MG]|uniref:Adenosylcobinamide-GDP ribazoletransferase n=1 Tax=Methanocorpusculum petauri TaxID=3002863 RepID=A0ABT4IIV6_9EURY|nr:adenosylcobinamide-GDP ribazoletransferase [Methanocorpusculum petauri]MCZ0861192.1 adenosylcobinamide-GDP ribazoletransferase [Methanocorpusculum petauri]MCZ9313650.1 adenosylcobinamide-GDP ribazoletransferase [Methanocorpusculum sp.]MDE2442875.1 adenosylcobinamide-GDP ribazoletransferase [Methanocorpusculum sp.]